MTIERCEFRTHPSNAPVRIPHVLQRHGRPQKARTCLTHEQVLEALDFKKANESSGRSERSLSIELSQRYGVCPKTIIHIWSGKTWLHTTLPVDSTKASIAHRLETRKKAGRPKGSKDRVPRKRILNEDPGKEKQVKTASLITDEIPTSDSNGGFVLSTFAPMFSLQDAPISIVVAYSWPDAAQGTRGSEDKSLIPLQALASKPLQPVDPFHLDWSFWC